MRSFIAVDIADTLKLKIAEIQRSISGYDAKLVEKENLHVTLKFLGDISEQVESVKNRLAVVAERFSPISLRVRGMGVFPNMNYIRVVWLGCDELADLQKAVDRALPEFPSKHEDKPHLTIARIRSGRNIGNLARFIEENRNIDVGTMAVNTFSLKKSELTPHGPVYEDVGVWGLRVGE